MAALACLLAGTAQAAERLTPEQQVFVDQAEAFMDEMDELYFSTLAEMNGNDEREVLEFPTEYAEHNVNVARGPVVEKAGRMRVVHKRPKMEFQGTRLWSKFYSMDVHPASPKMGMLHAAWTMNFRPDGKSAVGGWIDVLPGGMSEEDLQRLKVTMDKVFAKYGIDPEPHRKMSCDGSPGEGERRRIPACVGGSFYGRDMMSVSEQNFDFMAEAFEQFLRVYLELIEKNADAPYTAEDKAKQDYMRRNWLEDRFFSDPYTGNVVPYEVWALSTLPPVVKF
jgi:coproporphyrinogen III oxidase